MRPEIRERIAMIDRGEVPDGYKKTSIGILPISWDVKRSSELFAHIRNGFVGIAMPHYTNFGVKYLQGNNIKKGKINSASLTFISTGFHQKNTKSQLKLNDIVMVQSGHVGECAVIEIAYEGANCHALIILTPKKQIESRYYAFLFNSSIGERHFYKITTGNTIKHILASDMKKILLPMPSRSEQSHIVNILSAWDRTVELKEKLLDQKKVQKKGLIQRYLQKQLREIEGLREIGKIADQIVELNADNKDIPVLSCTKHHGLVDSLTYFQRKVYGDDLCNYKVVHKNCFAYATNHIEEGSIGLQNSYEIGLVSPMYTVFQLKKGIDCNYVYTILKTETYRRKFESMMSASVNRRGSLRWKEFSKIRIPVPTYEEQVKFSSVISTASSEIRLIEDELNQLKAQKKGLMQLLLTGKVRVPCAEREA